MPIPINVTNEFCIPHKRPRLFLEINLNNTFNLFNQFHTRISLTFYYKCIDSIYDSFFSNMMRVFSNILRSFYSNSYRDSCYLSKEDAFRRYLLDFICSKRSSDRITLTNDFYNHIQNSTSVQTILGRELATILQNNVLDYYNKLLLKRKKKEECAYKKTLYEHFKELKSYLHFSEKKINNQMKKNFCRCKVFINQKKYRKLKHLRCAIIL